MHPRDENEEKSDDKAKYLLTTDSQSKGKIADMVSKLTLKQRAELELLLFRHNSKFNLLTIYSGLLGLSILILEAVIVGRSAFKASTSGSTLTRLARWNDLLPSPGLRKQTAKMLADQQAHIKELLDEGRYKAAKWQVVCTYGLWLWYVVMRPISSLAKNLRGKVGGA